MSDPTLYDNYFKMKWVQSGLPLIKLSGWGASVMMVAAGALMVFGSCGDDDDGDDRHSVNFQMTSGRLLGKSQNGYV